MSFPPSGDPAEPAGPTEAERPAEADGLVDPAGQEPQQVARPGQPGAGDAAETGDEVAGGGPAGEAEHTTQVMVPPGTAPDSTPEHPALDRTRAFPPAGDAARPLETPPTPAPASAAASTPAARLTPPSAFGSVRARWLILFGVVGTLLLFVAGAVVALFDNVDAVGSELFAALFYVPMVAWALFVQWRNKVRLKLLFARPRIGTYWWVVLGMVLALLVFSLGASMVTAALFPDYVAGAEIDIGSNAVALALTIAVVPPVVEELIFRGLLLERWAVKWRLGTAVVVQAVFFGILHVDPIGAGVFGVALALMYLRTRTLWVPIVMHAANNGIVLVAVLFGGEAAQDSSPPATAGEALGQIVVGLVVMAVAAPFIVLFIRRNWPGPDTLTPYEEAELGAGALPPVRLGRVDVGGRQYRATCVPQGLVVSEDRAGRVPRWAIRYTDVTYMAVTPDWRHMLLMGGGGQLTMDFPQSGERARTRAMHALAQRVTAGSGTTAAWWR